METELNARVNHIARVFEGERRDSITLEEFRKAALSEPSAFGDLGATLVGRVDELLTMHPAQFDNDDEGDDDDGDAPFRPNYEWQPLPDPLTWAGLEVRMRDNHGRIPDPMQVKLAVPSLRGRLRVMAPRHASCARGGALAALCVVPGTWPGVVRPGYAPNASDVAFFVRAPGGGARELTGTVEEEDLFFIQKEVEVVVGAAPPTDAAPPPPPPPPPQRPPPLGPTVSQSTRNDALTGELRQIEREFDAALQPFEDRTLDVLDRVRTAEIDEVDRQGLIEQARSLRGRIQAAAAE